MAADTREIRVERATDPQRYHASDKLIWFDSPGTEPLDVQLRGVPEDQRFAAEVVPGVRERVRAG